MTWTKLVARHDKVIIDGTECSNAFRVIGLSSEHSEEDASGFSVSGADETLPGSTARGFSGEAFFTEEFAALVWPIHNAREIVLMSWQPNGLVDATMPIWSGNVIVYQFGPENTRGQVSTMPFSARAADENGIQVSDFT